MEHRKPADIPGGAARPADSEIRNPKSEIGKGLAGGRLLTFDSLPSTNTWAATNLDRLGHGDVVLALRQSGGHGRFDRTWLAPGDRGLTLSVIVGGDIVGRNPAAVGLLTGLAAVDALSQLSIKASVKWPNDVVVGGRKIAGILVEGDIAAGKLAIGLGMNVAVTMEDLADAGLEEIATSMLIETGATAEAGEIMAVFLAMLDKKIELYERKGESVLCNEWVAHDSIARNSRIRVRTESGELSGTYGGIDSTGRLLLTEDSGQGHALWTGEVEKVL